MKIWGSPFVRACTAAMGFFPARPMGGAGCLFKGNDRQLISTIMELELVAIKIDKNLIASPPDSDRIASNRIQLCCPPTMRKTILLAAGLACGCARTDIYYPYSGFDGKNGPPGGGRAVVLNGSDSLGNTVVEVTTNGVRFAFAGGIDNSTSTREGYRTIRHGIAAAAWAAGAVGVANVAAGAYSANQAASATSNVAASRASAATAASKNATAIRLAEIEVARQAAAAAAARAVPAAGSVIPSTIPSTVVPIVAP